MQYIITDAYSEYTFGICYFAIENGEDILETTEKFQRRISRTDKNIILSFYVDI